MYNPKLGRFLQRDPEGYVDGFNPYQLVRSNPVLLTDPFGTDGPPPGARPSTGPELDTLNQEYPDKPKPPASQPANKLRLLGDPEVRVTVNRGPTHSRDYVVRAVGSADGKPVNGVVVTFDIEPPGDEFADFEYEVKNSKSLTSAHHDNKYGDGVIIFTIEGEKCGVERLLLRGGGDEGLVKITVTQY